MMPSHGEEMESEGGEEEMFSEDEMEDEGKVPGKGADLSKVDDASLMSELEKRGFTISKAETEEAAPMETEEEESLFMEE
jgi:hypothetical protein